MHIQQLRKQINDLLEEDVEKKARFYKQTYYEFGPRAAKLLARPLRKQQLDSTIHKSWDPETNQLKYHLEEEKTIFLNYNQEWYTKASDTDVELTKNVLKDLDLPSIGKRQNDNFLSGITLKEINYAISDLKLNKTPGSDGFLAEWFKTFKEELAPLQLK